MYLDEPKKEEEQEQKTLRLEERDKNLKEIKKE